MSIPFFLSFPNLCFEVVASQYMQAYHFSKSSGGLLVDLWYGNHQKLTQLNPEMVACVCLFLQCLDTFG